MSTIKYNHVENENLAVNVRNKTTFIVNNFICNIAHNCIIYIQKN